MVITHDYKYIGSEDKKLVERGYGKISVYSLNFNRYLTETERKKNFVFYGSMTDEQRKKYYESEEFENIQRGYATDLTDVLNYFSKYDIHQLTPETSTMQHYDTDWDLFFYSNKGWNKKDYMDFFSLTFNKKRTPEQNNDLLAEIIGLMESIEGKRVCCRVQYCVVYDNDLIEKDAGEIFKKIKRKYINFNGMEGKIKVIGEGNGSIYYGFFKKRAKKKYYPVNASEILFLET